MIDDYFKLLEDWKQLPSYKLETRIDSFVGFALPVVLVSVCGIQAHVVIPELPIRLGTIYPEHDGKNFANRSYKVDFYVRTMEGENLFIEFKSDTGSRREGQDKCLQRSVKEGMKSIIEGILKIYDVTSYKGKYDHLLTKLRYAGLIDKANKVLIGFEMIRLMYIQPKILETDDPKEVLDFRRLAKAIRDGYPGSDVMGRLSASLETWAAD
ncbi:MAG: hypothetical protein JSV37_10220 [Anaerolineaceae bacterium]|nr:MAG: hypothetical protein JSV37_10220 [Anaerolineaceae bacterium]